MIVVSIIAYIVCVIIVSFILIFTLKVKKRLNITPDFVKKFDDKNNKTNAPTEKGYVSKYFHYVLNGYTHLVWGGETIGEVIKNYGNTTHKDRHQDSKENIRNFSEIPLKKELHDCVPNSTHADNLARGSTKCKRNLKKQRFGLVV
jgi:hypothetical protein